MAAAVGAQFPKPRSEAIRAEFIVENEEYKFSVEDYETKTSFGQLRIRRGEKGYSSDSWLAAGAEFRNVFGMQSQAELDEILRDLFTPLPQQLLFAGLRNFSFGFFNRIRRVISELEGLRVFQISPGTARQAGVPSVSSGLGKHEEVSRTRTTLTLPIRQKS